MVKSKKIKIEKKVKATTPISIEYTFNGVTKKIDTDNIYNTFKEIKDDPVVIKTPLEVSITHNGVKITKVYHMVKFRKFLNSDLHKALLAKQFNLGLGIQVNNYK